MAEFRKWIVILFAFVCACRAFGQTAPSALPTISVANVTLPTYIVAGASCSQFDGCAGFVSGIVPETSKVGGLYGAVTADLSLANVTVNGKQGYGLSPSFKFGQHKVIYNNTIATKDASGNITKMTGNMLLFGVDAGAAFSSVTTTTVNALGQTTTSTGSGMNVNLAGSFTFTYVRQLTPHLAIAVPIQMNWVAGVGPGGAGVWTPTGKIAIVWKP